MRSVCDLDTIESGDLETYRPVVDNGVGICCCGIGIDILKDVEGGGGGGGSSRSSSLSSFPCLELGGGGGLLFVLLVVMDGSMIVRRSSSGSEIS